ncbi:helix-turn-helix domain-containing protein [Dolosicoccus paucivorans]|uniref:helix-turn-helix domain-containing protein n=1 Tax=Dolosicoccus paucivorans TaxID=84521 RepID=UPI00088A5C50|nr:helix-turn-helix domain-containing protein [Dolosicoccus paucivorans]SDI86286.1 protein RodZ, contains Xre-like HTH and DUF4115 domains [Dolosicoccus paucivorans]
MISELSALLKQARISKGYTIDKLHKITKIPADIIEKLENEEFDELASFHHAKVYIKKYAKHVDLDPLEIMDEYEDILALLFEEDDEEEVEEEWVEDEIEEDEEEIPSRFDRYHLPNNHPVWNFLIKYLPVIGLVAVILGIMGTIIVTINRINSENKDEVAIEQSITTNEVISSVQPDSSTVQESPGEQAQDNPETDLEQELVLISDDPDPTIYEVDDLSSLTLSVEGLGTVWIGYFEDGAITQEHVLNAGDSIEITPSNAQSAMLQFGYKEGVKVTVNGKEIPLTNVTRPNQVEFVTKGETVHHQQAESSTNDAQIQEPQTEEVPNQEDSTGDDQEAGTYEGPAVLDPNYTPGGE